MASVELRPLYLPGPLTESQYTFFSCFIKKIFELCLQAVLIHPYYAVPYKLATST